MSNEKHFWLYILILEQGKYYVGITARTPEHRFKDHLNGFAGARWTRKYKPLKIIDQKDLGMMTEDDAKAYENKVVRRYMKEKGINNARGGDLTDEDDYVVRFGWIFLKEGWRVITTILFLLAVIAYLAFFR